MHGKGTFIIPNESSYTGEFRNGKAHGTGARTWHNGDNYTGEFNNGKLEGNGTYTFKTGNKYEGEFKDNSFDGQGTFTFSNGGKDTGEWKDNKLNGYAVSYLADGTIDKEGIWKDDEFQYAKKLKPAGTTSATVSSTNNQANTTISTALNAAQQKAEFERQKRIQLERELAALKAEQEQHLATIEADNQVPLIDIFSVDTTGKQGLIKGYVADNTGIAEVVY